MWGSPFSIYHHSRERGLCGPPAIELSTNKETSLKTGEFITTGISIDNDKAKEFLNAVADEVVSKLNSGFSVRSLGFGIHRDTDDDTGESEKFKGVQEKPSATP